MTRHAGRVLAAAAFVLLTQLLPASAAAQNVGSFRDIIADQQERYPLMELQDLYKLIHQASLGSEHAVRDTAAARRWLTDELANLANGPNDPTLDPLTPDSALVRVHLRPYLAVGGSPDQLLDAFVKTANSYPGSKDRMRKLWSVGVEMANAGHLPFSVVSMKQYFDEMAASGFPAAHHSAIYTETYRPAYRVVAARFLPETIRLP